MNIKDLTLESCVSRDLLAGSDSKEKHLFLIGDPSDKDFVSKGEDIERSLLEALNNEKYSNGEENIIRRDKLQQYVTNVITGEPIDTSLPESLFGISGFSTFLFLKIFYANLDNDSNLVRKALEGITKEKKLEWEYRAKLCGKILEYSYSNESGSLVVATSEEVFCTRESFLACKPDQITYYRWSIGIDEGFIAYPRADIDPNADPNVEYFPNDPFPSLPQVVFPDYSKKPADNRGIWCRGLNHKLYAEGDKIRICSVERQICTRLPDGSMLEGNCETLDKEDSKYDFYYKSTHQSCVDLLIKGEPPETLEMLRQSDYCLGRCEHPPIINSGGA